MRLVQKFGPRFEEIVQYNTKVIEGDQNAEKDRLRCVKIACKHTNDEHASFFFFAYPIKLCDDFVDLRHKAIAFPLPEKRLADGAPLPAAVSRTRVYFEEMVRAEKTTAAEEENYLKLFKRS